MKCKHCGENVWGEGYNPATGVRYYSHVKPSRTCLQELRSDLDIVNPNGATTTNWRAFAAIAMVYLAVGMSCYCGVNINNPLSLLGLLAAFYVGLLGAVFAQNHTKHLTQNSKPVAEPEEQL